MVYTVTLNPALDYVVHLSSLRFDDINRCDSGKIFFGGKGINVSVVLGRLGIANTALGFVGGFTGAKLEELLKQEGVDTDFVHISGGDTRINVKIECDTPLDINASGPSVSDKEVEALLSMLKNVDDGDFVVLAGSIPSTLPSDIYDKMLTLLDDRDVNVVVDATGDMLMNTLSHKPFLIKPNHHELGELFGVEIKSSDDAIKYAKTLQQKGAKNVLVSMSKDGAILVDEGGEVHTIANLEGKPVNTVGCGDSMVAGFVAGYLSSFDYATALRLGSACGNATVFCDGLASSEDINNALLRYNNLV